MSLRKLLRNKKTAYVIDRWKRIGDRIVGITRKEKHWGDYRPVSSIPVVQIGKNLYRDEMYQYFQLGRIRKDA